MLFQTTPLPGVFILEPERKEDDRGFFARTWCEKEFAAHGLETRFVQCSISFNHKSGTVRGMHYQAPPHEETKVVRCTAGAIYDVVLDLRTGSPTYGIWTAAELTATNRRAFYIPKGCAHGLQTLADDTDILYMISEAYVQESSRGVRWDDTAFGIQWPLAVTCISDRDRAYPDHTS